MISSWFIVIAVVALLVAVYVFFKNKKRAAPGVGNAEATTEQLLTMPGEEDVSPQPEENMWWQQLAVEDHLDLAVQLARMALPTWEKYAAENEILYRHAGTGPYIKIDKEILCDVLQDVQAIHFSDAANKRKILHQYYDRFVGPVIAMHDGDWPATYPVKKIFLAVYNIIKSTLEDGSTGNAKHLLSISINCSLECLDVSGGYSKSDTIQLMEVFKNQGHGRTIQPLSYNR